MFLTPVASIQRGGRILQCLFVVVACTTVSRALVRILTALAALGLDDRGLGGSEGHWSCQYEVEKKVRGQQILIGVLVEL